MTTRVEFPDGSIWDCDVIQDGTPEGKQVRSVLIQDSTEERARLAEIPDPADSPTDAEEREAIYQLMKEQLGTEVVSAKVSQLRDSLVSSGLAGRKV